MQIKGDQLYKFTSEATGKDSELYKSIGDIIFKQIYNDMKKPKNLVMKVKHLGQFIVRHSKIIILYRVLIKDKWDYENEMNNDFEENEKFYSDYLERRKEFQLLKSLLFQYERYRIKKKKYRKIRDELTKTSIQQKEIQKTS